MDGKLAALLARRRAAQEDSEREERGLYGNDALDVQHGGVLASTAGEQVKQASQISTPGRNNPSIQLHQRSSAAARDASTPQPEPAQPAPPPKKPAAGAMPKLHANKAPADAPGLGAYAAMSSPAKSTPPQAPAAGATGAAGASPSKPPPPGKAPAPAQPPAASIAQAPGFGAYAGRSPSASPPPSGSPPAAPASGGGPAAPQSGVLFLLYYYSPA